MAEDAMMARGATMAKDAEMAEDCQGFLLTRHGQGRGRDRAHAPRRYAGADDEFNDLARTPFCRVLAAFAVRRAVAF